MPLREPIAHDRPIARAKKLMFVACFLEISAESLLKHRLSALLYVIPKEGYLQREKFDDRLERNKTGRDL